MKKGYVYKFCGERIKILMFDQAEVFWDRCNEANELFSKKRKTIIYSRTDKKFFVKNTELIQKSKLTQDELNKHRPDLPLRLNCFKDVFWSDKKLEKFEDVKRFLKTNKISLKKLEGLKSKSIYLIPSGQQQSAKNPFKLEVVENEIKGIDILHNCLLIQHEFVNPNKKYFSRYRLIEKGREEKRLNGIGLFRLGLKGNIPSFYLGGSISWSELELRKNLIAK